MIQLHPDKKGVFVRASLWDKCNFSCEYCATDLGMENHTPLDLNVPVLGPDEYIENLNYLAARGFQTVSFTGGEPLLNPASPQIISGAKKLFQNTELTTNGTNLLKNIDVIRETIDVLKISLDAVTPELNCKITRNCSAKNAVNLLEQCCEAGIKNLGINFVCMKQNLHELEPLVLYASRLKALYKTNLYISVLDLYYSPANENFWQEQFVNLSLLRTDLKNKGLLIKQRIRFGCDSYNCLWHNVVVNMKDSMSCTHRASICHNCTAYCQEGIYSLKHSASGWISVCPSNSKELGTLLCKKNSEACLDHYIDLLNQAQRTENTQNSFYLKNLLRNCHE